MKIHEEELTNFCQYQHKLVRFTDGLNAIIGMNGSGKSNLFGAMRYALTGVHPNKGGKEANIRKLSMVHERSNVRLAFSHAGTRAEIVRHLRPGGAKTQLIIEGRETITGDARANTEIMEILGINPEILNTIALVAQANIFGFLDQTPGKRAEAFQKLFQTDVAGQVYDLLTSRLNKLTIPDVAASLDAVRARHEALLGDLRTLRSQADRTETCEQLDQAQQADQVILQSRQRRNAARQQADQLVLELAAMYPRARELDDQLFELEQNIKTLRAAADGTAEQADAAKKLLLTLAHQAQIAEMRKKIVDQRAGNAARRVQLEATKPLPPDDLAARYDVSANITRLAEVCRKQEQFLASFDPSTGVTECYVCHTPVTGLQAELEKTRQAYPVNKNLLAAAEARKAVHVQYDVNLQKYEQQLGLLKAEAGVLDVNELALGETPAATGTPAELQAQVTEHADFLAGIEEYERQKLPLQREEDTRAGAQDQIQRQVDQLLPIIEGCTYTAEDEAQALARVAARTQAILQRRQLDSQLAVAQAGVNETGNTLAELERSDYLARKIRARAEFLQRMRDPVHNAAAPKVVATRNIQRLVPAVNDQLATFGTTFTVRADEDLSFTARFLDGTEQPADRLSAGQQVVLALSFLLSVNFQLAANLGFLGLDEPTAYLDENHIRGFTPVLARLRTLAASRGLQCVIITHEASLAPLFDSVVQL